MPEPTCYSSPSTEMLLKTPRGSHDKSFEQIKLPPTPALERLGYGTGVDVLLYTQTHAGRRVLKSPWALKKVSRRYQDDRKHVVQKRLVFEARVLQGISHPNIIGFRGLKRTADGQFVLALERGQKSLHDMIEAIHEKAIQETGTDKNLIAPFPPKKILAVLKAMASALNALHNKYDVIHGDIKSANILVSPDFETIKLCDFGCALKIMPDVRASFREYVGTEPFIAHEIFRGQSPTEKVDMYALGCVIYEMIALEAPHMHLLVPKEKPVTKAKDDNDDEDEKDLEDDKENEDEDKDDKDEVEAAKDEDKKDKDEDEVAKDEAAKGEDEADKDEDEEDEDEDEDDEYYDSSDDDPDVDYMAYEQALGRRPALPAGIDYEAEGYGDIVGIFYALTEHDSYKRLSSAQLLEQLKEIENNSSS